MNIIEKVIRVRSVLDLTQKELAEKLGVTRTAVNLWEKGKSTPTARYQGKLDILLDEYWKSKQPIPDKEIK